ncbi:unnamed protein product [Moneuplotes crassus]|uniref:Uncharacterized protein n=1 Tax=Euplotes crassus TaxID=5936 RepID=A0AAD2CZ22_EUPCR|nr:unnamed protein product [Moneuplotes crassus]
MYSKTKIPEWNGNKTTEKEDQYCEKGPEDTISKIQFSNVTRLEENPRFISCSSWDNMIKVWELDKSYLKIDIKHVGETSMDAPVLSHCWDPENAVLFGACADNKVKMWDVGKDTITQVAEHDYCANNVFYCFENNILITTGWDGHIKFWDLKDNKPVFDIDLSPLKIWTASYQYPCLVGCLSDNTIFAYHMDHITKKNQSKPDLETDSPLKFQTRSVEAFPDGDGYIVTSIEGRCGVKNIDWNYISRKQSEDFNFKCHRKNNTANDVYPVHQVSFNYKFKTFATCGGDGTYTIWDKDKRKRLKISGGCDSPITAVKMSPNGGMLAYGFGYDWSKGCVGAGSYGVGMFIHPTMEKEIKSSS